MKKGFVMLVGWRKQELLWRRPLASDEAITDIRRFVRRRSRAKKAPK